jgi:hypothetical protein
METRETLLSAFFEGDSLAKILVYLCNTRAPDAWDPVTATVLDFLTGRLQLCLNSTGLLPFRGRAELVYPFHMMTPPQKAFLRAALDDRSNFCVCNDALLFHQACPDRLEPVPVLTALCNSVLSSKIHDEHKVRLGICNILLQRVQSVVPISRSVQQDLNATLGLRQ